MVNTAQPITARAKIIITCLRESPPSGKTANNGDTHYRIPLPGILYFASDRRLVRCVTENRTYTFYGKLDTVATEVGSDFIRVHQRYLVRAGAVDRIESSDVVLRSGERLPVSRSYHQSALLALARAELERS